MTLILIFVSWRCAHSRFTAAIWNGNQGLNRKLKVKFVFKIKSAHSIYHRRKVILQESTNYTNKMQTGENCIHVVYLSVYGTDRATTNAWIKFTWLWYERMYLLYRVYISIQFSSCFSFSLSFLWSIKMEFRFCHSPTRSVCDTLQLILLQLQIFICWMCELT